MLQGLSLPFLIRRLGLEYDVEEENEENEARLRVKEAVLKKIEELEGEEWVREDTAQRMRELYEHRRRRFYTRYTGQPQNDEEDDPEERFAAYKRLSQELLSAEREELLRLRDEGRISDRVRRRIERDLDLEETQQET